MIINNPIDRPVLPLKAESTVSHKHTMKAAHAPTFAFADAAKTEMSLASEPSAGIMSLLKNILDQLQALLPRNVRSQVESDANKSKTNEAYSNSISLPASNMTTSSPFDSNSRVFGSTESASNTGVHVGNDSNLTGAELTDSDNLDAVKGTRFSADASATNASRLDRSTSDPDDTVNFTRVEKFTKREWNASADTRTFSANYNLGDISNATGIFQIKESGSAPPAVVARMREVKEGGEVTGWNLVLESPAFDTNPTISIPLEDDGTPAPFKLEAKSLPAEGEGNRRFEITVRGQTFTAEHPNDDNDITFRWGLYNNSRASGKATISGVDINTES